MLQEAGNGPEKKNRSSGSTPSSISSHSFLSSSSSSFAFSSSLPMDENKAKNPVLPPTHYLYINCVQCLRTFIDEHRLAKNFQSEEVHVTWQHKYTNDIRQVYWTHSKFDTAYLANVTKTHLQGIKKIIPYPISCQVLSCEVPGLQCPFDVH